MKWFISAIGIAYAAYFFLGWTDVKKDWQNLARHLQLNASSENRIDRKGIVKHFFYTDEKGRAQFNIQARDSELIVHVNGHEILLQEEIEGVVGSYWDQVHQKAYTLYMPNALFDYPKKTFIGLQGQLEEFDTEESKLLGKGTFGEVECAWKGEPVIHLKEVHAEVPGKMKIGSGSALVSKKKVQFNDTVVLTYDNHELHSESAELDLQERCAKFFYPTMELEGGIFTSNGPLVVRLDPLALQVEGGSSIVWKDYAVQLDGLLHYEDEKLILKAPRHGIALNYPMGQIRASKGELQLHKVGNKFRVDQIDLLESVIASYGQPTFQYLIADGVHVVPEESCASLFSKSPSRVLLYDQINKLEMSADGVKVRWGEKIGEERIEGLGDVRFSFDQKEKGIIDALFRSR